MKTLYACLLVMVPLLSNAQATLKIVSKAGAELSFTVKSYELNINEHSGNATFLNLTPDIYEVTFYKGLLQRVITVINVPLRHGYLTTLLVDDAYNVRKTQREVDYYRRDMPADNVYNGAMRPPVEQYTSSPVYIMSDEDVESLARAIAARPFGDDKYVTATTGAKFANFTTGQVIKLLYAFGKLSSEHQLKFAKETFKKVVDKYNYYKAAETFTFMSDKDALLDFIKAQPE